MRPLGLAPADCLVGDSYAAFASVADRGGFFDPDLFATAGCVVFDGGEARRELAVWLVEGGRGWVGTALVALRGCCGAKGDCLLAAASQSRWAASEVGLPSAGRLRPPGSLRACQKGVLDFRTNEGLIKYRQARLQRFLLFLLQLTMKVRSQPYLLLRLAQLRQQTPCA